MFDFELTKLFKTIQITATSVTIIRKLTLMLYF